MIAQPIEFSEAYSQVNVEGVTALTSYSRASFLRHMVPGMFYQQPTEIEGCCPLRLCANSVPLELKQVPTLLSV